MNRKRVTATLLCCALGGCTTANRMAFDEDSNSVDVSTKAVVLMTIAVSGPDSRFVPEPFVVQIEKSNPQNKQDRQYFRLNKNTDAFAAEDGSTLYLARMALAPGEYKLLAVVGTAGAFPSSSSFSVPLLLDLAVSPGIAYVGRVTARLRPRNGTEFRAGPLLPLHGQAATGMSTGTWDVSVDDRFASDFFLFRSTYRVVAAAPITKSLLPEFDRAAVQRWWDSTVAKAEAKSNGSAASSAESVAAVGVRR